MTLIGIFDSGIGGLSVVKEIRQQLPGVSVIYLADQAHVPYGSRSLEEVRGFAEEISLFLLSKGARVIVIACNTASAAALKYLRQSYPQVPFVGMEPAVKPAAETTHTGVVGVLATPATFQGELYASVLERFAQGVTVLQDTCPGLVAQIEAGDLEGEQTRRILEKALQPMLTKRIDRVVLGCTHYPFVIPLIQKIVGEEVKVIDPAPAVARQVGRVLENLGMNTASIAKGVPGNLRILTSGDPEKMALLLPRLFDKQSVSEPLTVQKATWENGRLTD